MDKVCKKVISHFRNWARLEFLLTAVGLIYIGYLYPEYPNIDQRILFTSAAVLTLRFTLLWRAGDVGGWIFKSSVLPNPYKK